MRRYRPALCACSAGLMSASRAVFVWRIQIPDGGGSSAPSREMYVKWDRSSSAFLWRVGLRIAVPYTPVRVTQCLSVEH
jgi:hypothetical protein